MQTKVSTFRAKLFDMLELAGRGERIEFTYKGKGYRLVADVPGSKLDGISPVRIWSEATQASDEIRMKEAMEEDWQDKWRKRG